MLEQSADGTVLERFAPAGPRQEPVRLALPADRDHIVLARSAAAHLAAWLGLSVEAVEDFRLAVDEACCLVVGRGQDAGRTLICEFAESPDAVAVSVSAPVAGDFAGQQVGTFGWSLLESLVDRLWWSVEAGRAEVRLLKRRPGGGPAHRGPETTVGQEPPTWCV
ncbi:ATP-binding protein [Catenulispora subtropica]|uniref:Anti-sigma regulatory factor n=1 Tax=Catenulispora subtropica TaxID=450798 RepID=A0ABN2TAZ7_9ACTN